MHPPYRFNSSSRIQHSPTTFSIVSFNILSQACLEQHRHDRYAKIGQHEYYTWSYRLRRICNLLLTMMPSIICLQEVDLDPIIIKDLEKQFAQYGYVMILQDPKKSSHLPLFVTAILFLSDEFELVWHQSRSRALLAELSWKQQSKNIYIGNMHLQASPDQANVRLNQAKKALHRLEIRMAESEHDFDACPIILCGDFNDGDDSNVADFLYGKLEEQHKFVFQDVECFMRRFCTAEADQKTLPSYFTKNASFELDFIFYTRSNLLPVGALHALKGHVDLENMISNPPPNASWPSDHMPVGCIFTMQHNEIVINTNR